MSQIKRNRLFGQSNDLEKRELLAAGAVAGLEGKGSAARKNFTVKNVKGEFDNSKRSGTNSNPFVANTAQQFLSLVTRQSNFTKGQKPAFVSVNRSLQFDKRANIASGITVLGNQHQLSGKDINGVLGVSGNNVRIQNANVKANTSANQIGINLAPATQGTKINNTRVVGGLYGIHKSSSTRGEVIRNNEVSNALFGILFNRADDKNGARGTGKINIDNNIVSNSREDGISLDAGNDGLKRGISYAKEGSTIRGNRINDADNLGIALARYANVDVLNNDVNIDVRGDSDAFANGIHLEHRARDINIKGNDVDVLGNTGKASGIALLVGGQRKGLPQTSKNAPKNITLQNNNVFSDNGARQFVNSGGLGEVTGRSGGNNFRVR